MSRREKIHVAIDVSPDFDPLSLPHGTRVFLSLRKIPEELRRNLGGRGIQWFDIERKERSSHRHQLGEEVAQYLRRYGVRFNRPPGQRNS